MELEGISPLAGQLCPSQGWRPVSCSAPSVLLGARMASLGQGGLRLRPVTSACRVAWWLGHGSVCLVSWLVAFLIEIWELRVSAHPIYLL